MKRGVHDAFGLCAVAMVAALAAYFFWDDFVDIVGADRARILAGVILAMFVVLAIRSLFRTFQK